jgi:hypothetical protein
MFTGHALCGFVSCRNSLGPLFGRGELLALVKGDGIYEQDVLRVADENRYRSGADGTVKSLPDRRTVLSRLIANTALDYQSRRKPIPQSAIDREYEVLQAQLRDKSTWDAALTTHRLSSDSFRAEIAKDLRAEQSMEQQLVLQITVTTNQCREYYDANKTDYAIPVRFRARHLFVAAPPETPPDMAEAKNRAIEMLSTRLAHGEEFDELSGLCSEDEATKTRGGDLGFFSEYRMPSDFIAAVKNLRVGEVSPIVRTRLGFHIIQLTDVRGPRQISFDEAEPGIRLMLENAKRLQACAEIATQLSSRVDFVRLLRP